MLKRDRDEGNLGGKESGYHHTGLKKDSGFLQ